VNDVVSHNGSSWIAIATAAAGDVPGSAPTKWQKMADQGATGATGAQGPAGAQGAAGTFSTATITTRTATVTNTTSGTANCNAGEKALGGGYAQTGGTKTEFGTSRPNPATGTATGWTVTNSTNWTGTVYVICGA
jgi:hypothetical protein